VCWLVFNTQLTDTPAERAQQEAAVRAWLEQSGGWGKRAKMPEPTIHTSLQTAWYDAEFKWFEVGVTPRGIPKSVCRGRDVYAVFHRKKSQG
jgi:hypothetical protein